MVNNRIKYVVLKDFDYAEHTPLGTYVYNYKVGNKLTLYENSPKFQYWIDNGYVEKKGGDYMNDTKSLVTYRDGSTKIVTGRIVLFDCGTTVLNSNVNTYLNAHEVLSIESGREGGSEDGS